MILLGAALVVTGAIACNTTVESDDDNLREDVLTCENAVAVVESCCPFVQAPPDACLYHHYYKREDCGCMSGDATWTDDRQPAFDLATSQAILAGTCDAVTARGGCAAVAAVLAKPNATHSDSTGCSGQSSSSEDL
jgi:hypothetical protein